MRLRKSDENDIKNIMEIIEEAQIYFKEQGINQWQNNYPNENTIKNDIKNCESYVLIKDEQIIATTAISFDGESTYNKIYEGEWMSNDCYGVIHRIAVRGNYKGMGIASKILKEAEKLSKTKRINSIRIDTHEDNKSMQKVLLKNGYKYCGVIYLKDNSKRIAFEKLF